MQAGHMVGIFHIMSWRKIDMVRKLSCFLFAAITFVLISFDSTLLLNVAAENVFYYDTEENYITITGSSLKSVESIPDELENLPVKELSSRALFACTNSESSITIPETVEVIGDECFLGVIGSGYTTYFLPASIQSIGDYALGYTCYENYQEGCVIGDKIEKLKNVVIYGYSNTVAETYATENGFTFVALNNSVSGDVNNDGSVTISDAVLLQKCLLSVPDTTLPNWKAADLYEDERLNVFDLCLLKRMLIEL